ncbi:hypothetical protein CORC01_13089 [Colletotrichum orchidophilum]|uniref:Uncharacterized protein n=1 Tax=Colletotrichum orchidophilum TaxID=1209926 RepID=A0A1G4ARG5_9PEZI|nr:uncharacterized protein CORC01_13089 [Colletotrichum orchidophilum]OHE91612.1 hypothetical protein CORC01_13089 [Colletotrichum orchidophilum]
MLFSTLSALQVASLPTVWGHTTESANRPILQLQPGPLRLTRRAIHHLHKLPPQTPNREERLPRGQGANPPRPELDRVFEEMKFQQPVTHSQLPSP